MGFSPLFAKPLGMKTYFYLCFFIYVTVPVFTCSAQSKILIKEWGKAHGIERTIIFGVFQNKNRLIWICTYNGLYYFDGFRAYKSQILEADGKTPFDGIVNQLVQTSDGRYWLKVEYKLGTYDIYSKIFKPFKIQPADLLSALSSVAVQLFVWDQNSTYLVDQELLELIPMIFVDHKGAVFSDVVRVSGETRKFFSFLDGFPVQVIASEIPGQYIEHANPDSTVTFWNELGFFKYNNDVHGNTWYKHPLDLRWMITDSFGKDISKEKQLHFEKLNVYYLLSQPDYSWFITDRGFGRKKQTSQDTFSRSYRIRLPTMFSILLIQEKHCGIGTERGFLTSAKILPTFSQSKKTKMACLVILFWVFIRLT